MTPEQLFEDANHARAMGTNMTLVTPRPWRNRPQGFPRGELLCEQPGQDVRSYDPEKVIRWLEKNDLVPVTTKNR